MDCSFVNIYAKEREKEKRDELKDLLIGIDSITIAIGTIIRYTYIIANPQIKQFEGVYDTYRNQRKIYGVEYKFKDNEGINGFMLNVSAKKEIWPEGFVEGEKYRIYYEVHTDIIVKVEKLSQ